MTIEKTQLEIIMERQDRFGRSCDPNYRTIKEQEQDEEELVCNECGGELSMLHQYPAGEEGYCEKCDKWTCDEDWDV